MKVEEHTLLSNKQRLGNGSFGLVLTFMKTEHFAFDGWWRGGGGGGAGEGGGALTKYPKQNLESVKNVHTSIKAQKNIPLSKIK